MTADLVTDDQVEKAIDQIEKTDIDLANLLRNYIRGLLARLRVLELADDEELD